MKGEGDSCAKERLRIKSKATLTRRSMRYKTGTDFAAQVAERMLTAPAAQRPRRKRAAMPDVQDSRAVEMIDAADQRSGVGVE